MCAHNHHIQQFSQYFSIKAFRNDDYSSEITQTNRVNLGAEVYLEISENKAIPNNIDYYLTDCTGFQDIDDPSTYADASHAIADVSIITCKFDSHPSLFRLCATRNL